MNLLDILILVPLLLFAFKGFKNGFVKEVFSVVGLVLAVFFAFQYMAELSNYLYQQLETDSVFVPYFSFGIIFLLVLLAVQVIIFFIEGVLRIAFLGLPNRIIGSVFGAFKTALIISIVLLLFSGFSLPDQETRSDSLFYPYVIKIAPATYNTLAKIYPGAGNYMDTVQNALDEHSPI